MRPDGVSDVPALGEMIARNVRRRGIASVHRLPGDEAECEYVLTFRTTASWNFGRVLDSVDLRVRRDGLTIGTASLAYPVGPAPFWERDNESKIELLVGELFPGFDDAAR